MEAIECRICLEEVAGPDSVPVPGCPCRHAFCVGCWQRHLATVANEKAALRCPLFAECNHELVDCTYLRALPAAVVPAEILCSLDEQSVQRTLLREFVPCPGPGCGNFVEPPGGDRSGKWRCNCPACGTSFCTGCGAAPYHYGCSCAELPALTGQWLQWHTRKAKLVSKARADFVAMQKRAMENFMADEERKERLCRLCPHCDRVVEKNGGCNVMRCGYDTDTGLNRQYGCGNRFHWEEDAKPYVSSKTQQPRWAEFVESAALRADGVMHGEWMRCDLCHGEMRGLRFQCVHCPAFNCCQKCEPQLTDAATHNPRHIFRIHDKPEDSPALSAQCKRNLHTGRSRRVRVLTSATPPKRVKPVARIWQWQRDDGRWESYPAAFQPRIDVALALEESVLLEVAGRTQRVMPLQGVQIDMVTDDLRTIRLAPE